MKTWLKVLVVVFLIGAIALAIAAYQLNTRYGWMAASAISHDTLATEQTRVRVAINTLQLGDELSPYLPADLAVPTWLPWDVPAMLPRVLPREVALLGGTDFRSNTFGVTLFINEQRGGPVLPMYLNTRTRFKRGFPAVTWDEPGFTLEGRGALSAKGHLDLPANLEATVLETWPPDPPAEPLVLAGGHLAEAVIDNRNGDILALIAGLAPAWNMSLERLQSQAFFVEVVRYLGDIDDVRVACDFESADTLLVQVRMSAEPASGKELSGMIPFGLASQIPMLQQRYGITLSQVTEWDATEGVVKIDLTFTGIEAKLKAYFQRMLPRRPAPAEPAA